VARGSVALMQAQQRDRSAAWQRLRGLVGRQAPLLSAPPPVAAGLCASCRGPARPGQAHCYPCALYQDCLPGLLPDVVAPVAYAAKGGQHAANLWLYKSGRPGAGPATAALSALLLVFLRDHGRCAWRRAGMLCAGMTGPTHVAVVPSCRARPGVHPLRALAAPYLRLPWVHLSLACRGDSPPRDPDPGRFHSERIAGAAVLLLDDTWTSGASATSAAAALRLAGARSVAIVVLGRHLDATPADEDGAPFSPAGMPFRPWLCAVHAPAAGQ
jgi:hypothetical protein